MIPNPCTITNLSSGTTGGTAITTADMETKCTQTKLDDELEPPLILQTMSSATTSESIIKPPSTIISTVEPNSGSLSRGPSKSGSVNEVGVPTAATLVTEPALKEVAEPNPVTAGVNSIASPPVAADPPKSGTSENPNPGAAAATATATESKGEIGTWTSSTEVCPWEDEENRRESHAPFVKTYATLGYL
jgi:hypothetical protein